MATIKKSENQVSQDQGSQWFSEFIHQIETDKLMYETDTMPEEVKKTYENFISGKLMATFKEMKDTITMEISARLILSFLNELLGKRKLLPQKVAFHLAKSKVYAWIEINDDDDAAEKAIFLSEAKANFDFSEYNLSLSTTVVESSDKLETPSHYQELAL